MNKEKKCARINLLINRLELGEDVSRKSLSRVLTPELIRSGSVDLNRLTPIDKC